MRRRDLPLAPEWSTTIAFQLVDPSGNRYRAYSLWLTQDLFGDWVLLRAFGRIGKAPRVQGHTFPSRSDAEALAHRLIRRRLLHGYRVTASH
ncbi:MAG: WGR domain-containing protein [Chloroflexi bacterium]|nr:WGR domain-containing protein [Chloroflexota bacterium]